jgi:hypothetical protein
VWEWNWRERNREEGGKSLERPPAKDRAVVDLPFRRVRQDSEDLVEPLHLKVCQRAHPIVAAMVGMQQPYQVFIGLPDFIG